MMRTEQHRNWLLMIAEAKVPLVLWTSFAVAVLVMVATFLFKPVYGARTILALDSDLTKVLRNIEVSYPSVTQQDYIRYEYFATNAVSLMQMPSLGDQLVTRLDVRNRQGERMFPEYFIQPGAFKLLYGNDGQGIKVKWVSDTQQFSITGYAPDPARAVAFSREYTDIFLKENTAQFQGELKALLGRIEAQVRAVTEELADTDRQIIEIKNRYRVSTVADELSALPDKIYTARENLAKTRRTEGLYQEKLALLRRELEEAGKLRKTESVTGANPQVDALKSKIVSLTEELLSASVDYTPEHPRYQAIDLKLNAAKETLRRELAKTFSQEKESITDHYVNMAGEVVDLTLTHLEYAATAAYYENLLASYDRRSAELNEAQAQLAALADRQDAIKEVLSTARQSRISIGAVLNAPLPFFRIVSPAAIDGSNLKNYKYFPKRKLLFAVAFAGTACLMFAFIVGRDLHLNRLYRGWQVRCLGESLEYAEIPDLAEGSAPAAAGQCLQDVFRAVSAAPLVRVQGGDAGAGRVTVGRALARFFQQRGLSVLLVDGDLERPCALCSGAPGERPGLLDYLKKPAAVEGLLNEDLASGVPLLAPGRRGDLRDLDAVNLQPVGALLAELQSRFDRIVWLDAPLLLDRVHLADGLPPHDLIAVYRSERHTIYETERLLRRAEASRGQFSLRGVVVNRVRAIEDLFSLRAVWEIGAYPLRVLSWPSRH